MTSRERFLKVINGEMPDRVPVTLFIVEQGHFITQVCPDIDPMDQLENLLKIVEFQKEIGLDVMIRPVFGYKKYKHLVWGGVDVTQQTENWEVKTELIRNGNTIIEKSNIKTPDGTLTQEFSTNELRKGTYMFCCTKQPLEKPEDIETIIKYEPPIDLEFKSFVKDIMKKVQDAIGNDGVTCPFGGHGPFNYASLFIPSNELYSLFLTEPEYYDRLMAFALQRSINYTEAILDGNPDCIYTGGNVPSGILGKKIYNKYVLPYEKKHVGFCQKTGVPAMYHNCGMIMDLVESYKELGIRIVEPFSPYPLGDADLVKAKEIVNGDYIMLSGIDQVNVLQKGTISQVEKMTEEVMKKGKPGGKFIMQPVDFIEYETPIENIEAFTKTAIKNAWY